MEAVDLDNIFFLPLSQQALEEMENLKLELQTVPYEEDTYDQWKPFQGTGYSSKKFYDFAFSTVQAGTIFSQIWKSKCTPWIKFFIWLVLIDRLNTKFMLTRRHITFQGDNTCVLCTTGADETIDHLFFSCPFAGLCWTKISFNWDLTLNLEDRILKGTNDIGLDFSMEAAMIAAWELWKIRNDRVFNRGNPTVSRRFCNFKNQCLLHTVRFKADLRSAFCSWLDAFS